MCFSFTCFEVWRFAEEQGDHRSIYNGAMMDFYKRARIVCLAIPYGEAATYGQIAMLYRAGREKPAVRSERPLNNTICKENFFM